MLKLCFWIYTKIGLRLACGVAEVLAASLAHRSEGHAARSVYIKRVRLQRVHWHRKSESGLFDGREGGVPNTTKL